MKNCTALWMILALAAFSIFGCDSTGNNPGNLPDPTVRFFNESPSADSLDFLLNDSVSASALAFGDSDADFKSVPFITDADGGYDVSATVSGQTTDLDRFATTLARDSHAAFVSIGLPDPGGEDLKRLQLLFLGIDRTAPNGTKSRLLIVNGLIRETGIENVPIKFQDIDPTDPGSIDRPTFSVNSIGYGGNSVLTIDSGSHTVIARRAEVSGLLEFARSTFNFQPGKVYLVVVTGQENNATVALQPKFDIIELATKL